MQGLLLLVLIWLGLGTLIVGWTGRKALVAFWREPMLKRPVFIVESDDWGAGPLDQGVQLDRISAVLASHVDRDGHKAVMTLGLVLGVPDGARIAADGFRRYHRKLLGQPEFESTLAAIKRGAETGVFALQIHGEEHYWPPALLAASRVAPSVAAWLNGPEPPKTEALPPALQSRWIDAAELPSKPLRPDEIRTAALAETASFRAIFGYGPTVAVPPTFIWNDSVEAAWAEAGVQFVVTPGRRYQARGADGKPAVAGPPIANADSGVAGIIYVVRDDYFEPERGHKAERAVAALTAKTLAGRPTLLETHRANFVGDPATAGAAIDELHRALKLALRRFPDLMFLSTEELATQMRRRDPRLIEPRLSMRLHVWLRRLWGVSRLRKLACFTGVIFPAWLLYVLTWRGPGAPRPSAR